MRIFRLCSLLSDDSQSVLEEFFQGCPFPINQPLLLELGTVLDASDVEVNLSASYQVRPQAFSVTHNFRTGLPALVWVLREFTENVMRRHLDVGTVVQPLTEAGLALWLSDQGLSMGRRQKAWFNSREDSLSRGYDLGNVLTLTFEGEELIPLDVPSAALLPEVRLVNT